MNNNPDAIKATGPTNNQPYMMLGAGQLCAAVNKEGDEQSGWQYRFNLFRMSKSDGIVEQRFVPSDITDMVKLARVLAFAIADDGCLSRELRDDLRRLSSCLDEALPVDSQSY